MSTDFENMSIEDALSYCYLHKKKYLAELYETGEDGQQQQFDCLITIIENGAIHPRELPDYGMEYD